MRVVRTMSSDTSFEWGDGMPPLFAEMSFEDQGRFMSDLLALGNACMERRPDGSVHYVPPPIQIDASEEETTDAE